MHPLLIPLLRILSDGKFHAGSDLAQQLNISRATVSNILKSATAVSIQVFKVRGRGYQLPETPDWLDADLIHRQLKPGTSNFVIEVVDNIDSTNTALLRAAGHAPHRHCLAAEFQHAGRGRRGRAWVAALGGSLTCSVRWRFSQGIGALAGLSLATGVALLRCLHQFGVSDAQLKWPNDLLWQGRKLAGILIEVQGEANGPSLAVIGIGINLRIPAALRNQVDQAITDLHEILGQPVSRNALLSSLLNQLELALTEFETHGLQHLRHEWNAGHAHAGQALCVTLSNGDTLTGIAEGLSAQGALLLRDSGGKQLAVHSGEVHLARQAS